MSDVTFCRFTIRLYDSTNLYLSLDITLWRWTYSHSPPGEPGRYSPGRARRRERARHRRLTANPRITRRAPLFHLPLTRLSRRSSSSSTSTSSTSTPRCLLVVSRAAPIPRRIVAAVLYHGATMHPVHPQHDETHRRRSKLSRPPDTALHAVAWRACDAALAGAATALVAHRLDGHATLAVARRARDAALAGAAAAACQRAKGRARPTKG